VSLLPLTLLEKAYLSRGEVRKMDSLHHGSIKQRLARRRRMTTVVMILALASPLIAQTSPSPVLTEDEAVELAKSGNRDVARSALDVSHALAAIREARTNYFPQTNIQITSGSPIEGINLTLPKGVLGTYASAGPIPAKDISIHSGNGFQMFAYGTIGQPLSQLYKIHLGVETARVEQQIAAEGQRQQSENTVSQLRQLYHQIAQSEAAIGSDTEQIRSLQEALHVATNNVIQGTALKADQLQAQAALAQQKITILHDQNTVENQKEQLNEVLGRPLDTPFTVEPVSVELPSEESLNAARSEALRQRPEIRQADLQTKKAVLDVRTERADYIPAISAQVTYLGFQNVQFLPPNVVNAGFSLQWSNPWDWGKRHAHITGLKDVVQQQQLTAESARQRVLLDVDQRFRALQEARLSVDAAQLTQDASAERLRNVTNQYHEQAALLQDVLRQNVDLAQRNADYATSLARYWTARADFHRAIGE
jgi:outer membrane protein TolC